jgi:hypothetical protein
VLPPLRNPSFWPPLVVALFHRPFARYFALALDHIRALLADGTLGACPQGIAFPADIGCGIGGGDWRRYSSLLEGFARSVLVPVYVVNLKAATVENAGRGEGRAGAGGLAQWAAGGAPRDDNHNIGLIRWKLYASSKEALEALPAVHPVRFLFAGLRFCAPRAAGKVACPCPPFD